MGEEDADPELVDGIYEAALIPDAWPRALDRLAAATGTAGGILFTLGRAGVRWTSSEATRAAMAEFVADGWADRNPRASRLAAMSYPGFVHDLDVFAAEELDRIPLYTDLLRPHGFGWGLGTHVPVPTGDVAVFSLEGRLADGPIARETVLFCDRLRPHLARAALIAGRLGLERARAAADVLDILGLPAAVVSHRWRIVAANSRLEAHVPDLIEDGAARVRLRDPRADLLLETALRATTAPGRRETASIPIPARGEAPPHVIHVVPVRGEARDLFSAAAAMLVVMPVAGANLPDTAVLQGLFDLTPAEARVARGIAMGGSVEEIALRAGVATGTVRSQLKSVFAKTGQSRQADLVALLVGAALPGEGAS